MKRLTAAAFAATLMLSGSAHAWGNDCSADVNAPSTLVTPMLAAQLMQDEKVKLSVAALTENPTENFAEATIIALAMATEKITKRFPKDIVFSWAYGQKAAVLKVATDNKAFFNQVMLIEDKDLRAATMTAYVFGKAFGTGEGTLMGPAEVIVKAAVSSCNK